MKVPREFSRRFVQFLTNRFMPLYPLPAYHFLVEWGGTRTGFTEVSGLGIEAEVLEYREGGSLHTVKIPGQLKYSNVILKRGIVKGDNEFFQWISTINGSAVQRRDVMISLLDETHQPVMRWRLSNAWPSKIEASTLNANASEIAIEIIELTHEGITIET
jgi:phage tail-like protein